MHGALNLSRIKSIPIVISDHCRTSRPNWVILFYPPSPALRKSFHVHFIVCNCAFICVNGSLPLSQLNKKVDVVNSSIDQELPQ